MLSRADWPTKPGRGTFGSIVYWERVMPIVLWRFWRENLSIFGALLPVDRKSQGNPIRGVRHGWDPLPISGVRFPVTRPGELIGTLADNPKKWS